MRAINLAGQRTDVDGNDWGNARDDVVRRKDLRDDALLHVQRRGLRLMLRRNLTIVHDYDVWGCRLKWRPFWLDEGHWQEEGIVLLELWIVSFRHWSGGRLFGLCRRGWRGCKLEMYAAWTARNGDLGVGRGSSLLELALEKGRFDDGQVVVAWFLDMLAIDGN